MLQVGYPPEFMKCLDGVNLKVKMMVFLVVPCEGEWDMIDFNDL